MDAKLVDPEKVKIDYPKVYDIGLQVYEDGGCQFIPRAETANNKFLAKKKNRELFGNLFGIQTCHVKGMYPWDVEAVLELMINGKRIGSQAVWD